MRGKEGSLERGRTGYFENVYEVSYLVYCSQIISKNTLFNGFSVQFSELKKWLGHTKKQDEILLLHEKNQLWGLNGMDLDEFSVIAHNEGTVVVGYHPLQHHSAYEFSAGIQFPPSLMMFFSQEQSVEEAKQIFDDLCEITSFVVGGDLSLNSVELCCGSECFQTQDACLYFPKNKAHKERRGGYVLFPIGRNLRFDDFGYPELDLEFYGRYFSLNGMEREKWKKYHRYKRMGNVEEQFLGYFRLLESLTFKSKNYLDADELQRLIDQFEKCLEKRFGDKKSVNSFLRGLNKYNNSKYNTAKCLRDFYDNIPSEITEEWLVKKSEIDSICKLRNDISHANDYKVSNEDLLKVTKFIEVLLVFALFLKLGISSVIVSKIIHRMEGYHLIQSNKLVNCNE